MSFAPYRFLPLILCLAACSTVVEGRSQQVTVNSSPPGAQCLVQQAGDVIARITTPGTAQVGKSKNDLVISCSKDGYESVSLKNRSDLAITSFGNMAFYQLSFLGDAVDSATGASNKYDSKVFVELRPAAAPTAFPAPPGFVPSVKLPVESVALMSMQVPMPVPAGSAPPALPAALPAAAPQPAAATQITTPAAAFPGVSPAIRASEQMASAALSVPRPSQPVQLSYAEQTVQASLRPPFDVMP